MITPWMPAAKPRQRRISSVKDARLRAAAESRLSSSHYHPIRDVRCDVVRGVIILTGVVACYYIKQLAQEAVMRINGHTGVENRLKVA